MNFVVGGDDDKMKRIAGLLEKYRKMDKQERARTTEGNRDRCTRRPMRSRGPTASAQWSAILTRAAGKELFRNVAAAHKTLPHEDKRRRYGDFGDADGEAGRSRPIAR